jgi:hypothetical protein
VVFLTSIFEGTDHQPNFIDLAPVKLAEVEKDTADGYKNTGNNGQLISIINLCL